MTGMQAAMGVSQTPQDRDGHPGEAPGARAYNRLLAGLDRLQLRRSSSWARNVCWMYAVVLREDAPVSRDVLVQRLEADGIETRTFFCPMSDQPCVTRVPGYRPIATPSPIGSGGIGLYLPSSPTLSEEQP